MVLVFLWLVFSRFTELKGLLATLAQGQWQWVLAAAGLQAVYYLLYAVLYHSAFNTIDIPSRVRELLPVVFASMFVTLATPAGGAGGAALFVDDATRRGHPAARAAIGSLLTAIADFCAFLLVLVAGIGFLLTRHDLQGYEVLGAGALLLLASALSGLLALSLWRPAWVQRLLNWVQRTVNHIAARIKRPPLLSAGWAEQNAAEFREAAMAVAAHPERLARTVAIAFGMHVVDLITLQALFFAFHQRVGLGVLVAGYAMGTLFWLVAITPQGVGVVEGVMALVFASLGVSAARATVITLAYRGLSVWLPVVVGIAVLRRMRTFGAGERSRAEVSSVHTVAVLTGVMGVVNVLSALTPSLRSRLALLARFSPLEVRHGGHLTAALAGFALLVLARGLWRRKRAAWWLTEVVLVVSIASHLLKGLDYEEALLAAALAVWLGFLRAEFHARSDRPSALEGLRALLASTFFTLGYGVLGFYLLDRHFRVSFGWMAALKQTVIMFTQFYDPGLEPLSAFGRSFADSIYVVGAGTLGYALLMLLRPILVRQPASAAERARARAIVEAHGHTSLARCALFNDKGYFFSAAGSVIAYVAKEGIALALGDPIGPPENVAAVIAGFQTFCARNDWQPAFYQTLPDHLKLYQAAGLDTLCIGQEAIVHLATFTLSGNVNKALRAAFNRRTREGYRAELHAPPLDDALLQELRTISDEWLSTMGEGEMQFSLGWFEDDYIRNSPVMAVHTAGGLITAFANITSEYQRNEATIDLMRHRRDVEWGTMDFLFVSLFQWAKQQGFETFNLGLSGLAGVGEGPDAPPIERALRYVSQHANRFYNFQGLFEFKDKFHPEWSPRYLVYPGPASLPLVANALLRAHSGDGFWRDLFTDWLKQLREPKSRSR